MRDALGGAWNRPRERTVCMLRLRLLFLSAWLLLLTGCVGTLPLHDPIYPASGENVTYTLDTNSRAGIDTIKLYETISTINAAGTVTVGTEAFVQEWLYPDWPETASVSYTKTGGYSADRLVNYRFWIRTGRRVWGWRLTASHNVTYAIRPYPVANQPAPVYVQGDVDKTFDIVLIPDTDITNLATFRGHCRSMIRDAVFAEPSIRTWKRQFNFYINPLTGHATDYDRIAIDGLHQTPTNWANLSFAEVKVLMHQNDLRDYASGGLFSTERQNRGTMMHEGGHGMFGLADEYPGGSHWQAADYPNNWSTLAGAQTDAPGRHKTAADARQMGTSGWYKICADACQMNTSGLVRSDYDAPCADRVLFSIIDIATP